MHIFTNGSGEMGIIMIVFFKKYCYSHQWNSLLTGTPDQTAFRRGRPDMFAAKKNGSVR